MVTPLSRNAIDATVGVNTQRCSNITGDKCNNGQASFWYSQGCFIGCPTCDNASGRRQTDLCGLGKKQTLTDVKYWTVNRDAIPFSDTDIYKHNVRFAAADRAAGWRGQWPVPLHVERPAGRN